VKSIASSRATLFPDKPLIQVVRALSNSRNPA
jgi:hypothetical protein